jgi:hypothetical protein
MENMEPAAAAAALVASDRARSAIARSVRVPRGHDVVIGTAVAVQIATAVIGIASADDVGASQAAVLAWVTAGVVVFLVAALVEVVRFRRINGVRLDGFTGRVVLGTDLWASLSYGAAAVVAYLAADRGLWWLALLVSSAGGAAYALCGRRWMRRYREVPERGLRTESALLLGLYVAVALVALVLLAANAR